MDWTGRARAVLGERIVDEDVLAELAEHAAAVYAQARAEGASVEEATRLGEEQLAIGPDAIAELARRRRRKEPAPPPPAASAGLVGLAEELRSAVRLLLRERSHSLLVVLTLATGIGVATVLFSVV
ncbi:MAG TPA: hypothetical protein VEQ10_15315, partial [Vicinamibacteria bacterium]|nr:hypothetical protein [Vicinamibacteria bacterium]